MNLSSLYILHFFFPLSPHLKCIFQRQFLHFKQYSTLICHFPRFICFIICILLQFACFHSILILWQPYLCMSNLELCININNFIKLSSFYECIRFINSFSVVGHLDFHWYSAAVNILLHFFMHILFIWSEVVGS